MVALESVNFFKSLAPDELQNLRAVAQERRFTPGTEIFHEDDPGDGVYVVKEGLVEISGRVAEDVRRAFSRIGPGEIFGEMAVVKRQPCLATATALKETTVYFIPGDEIRALLQRSPAFAFNVLQEVSRRLQEFDRIRFDKVVEAERLAVIGNFAHSIMHDLTTPLTIVGLSIEIASAPDTTPEKRFEAHERIRRQISRINDMVAGILEFTRRRQVEAAPTPANYSGFVAAMLPDLKAEAGAKSAVVEIQSEPPAGKILLSAHRLRRVFSNLLKNSTGMMPDGGKIYLRFHAGDGEIITEIEDTGPGIAPEIFNKLFQPFTSHGEARGAGLGLSVCKKIIEDHHGRIWARSEPGHGAIFCFALPLAK
jgi:signal transduction histidine kinase